SVPDERQMQAAEVVPREDDRHATNAPTLHLFWVVGEMHQRAADCLPIDGVLDVLSPVAQADVSVVENEGGHPGFLAVPEAAGGEVSFADAPGRLACFCAFHLATGKADGPDAFRSQHRG